VIVAIPALAGPVMGGVFAAVRYTRVWLAGALMGAMVTAAARPDLVVNRQRALPFPRVTGRNPDAR
jgi:hypothetical protein